jgi:hypothetical protein
MVLKNGKKSYFYFPLSIFFLSILVYISIGLINIRYSYNSQFLTLLLFFLPLLSLLPFIVNSKRSNIENWKFYVLALLISLFIFFVLISVAVSLIFGAVSKI